MNKLKYFKVLLIIITLICFSCRSADERIKVFSYTEEWYFIGEQRYQVYKTLIGRSYILVLDKSENKIIRKYI